MTAHPLPPRPESTPAPVPVWALRPSAPAPAPRRRTAALVLSAALLAGAAGGAVGAAVAPDDAAPPVADSTSAVRTSATGDVADVAAEVLPSVVSISVRSASGSGSGVVLDEAGHVLTNDHVVAPGANGEIAVLLSDGRRGDAHIVGTDPVTDLAVLQVDVDGGLTPIALGRSADVAVGDAVLAVGSPLGLDGTVTTGIISALDRTVRTNPETPLLGALQTDAAINPGNSGGALVDAAGRLIGINTAISSTSGGSIGLGFAIPVDQARSVADELIRTGRATHPSLGVAATTVADGALLQQVPADSAAAEAGLEAGDVITAVDADAVTSVDELVLALRERGVDEPVEVTYLREDQERTAQVRLRDRV